MDYSPPGYSVHGMFQARILEWLAILFSRGSSQHPAFLHWQVDSLPLSYQGSPQGPFLTQRKKLCIAYFKEINFSRLTIYHIYIFFLNNFGIQSTYHKIYPLNIYKLMVISNSQNCATITTQNPIYSWISYTTSSKDAPSMGKQSDKMIV